MGNSFQTRMRWAPKLIIVGSFSGSVSFMQKNLSKKFHAEIWKSLNMNANDGR